MSEIHVAILLPTAGRAQQLLARVGAMLRQATPAGVRRSLYLSVEDGDDATRAAGRLLAAEFEDVWMVLREDGSTAVQGWNLAHFKAYAEGADWYVTGADDLVWHEGWLAEALGVARGTGAQVIGFADGYTQLDERTRATHLMISRRFAEVVLRGFIPPEYGGWRWDREICERAMALGVYAPAVKALLEHRHPDVGKAEMDETYRRAWHFHDEDLVVYRGRREASGGWGATEGCVETGDWRLEVR